MGYLERGVEKLEQRVGAPKGEPRFHYLHFGKKG